MKMIIAYLEPEQVEGSVNALAENGVRRSTLTEVAMLDSKALRAGRPRSRDYTPPLDKVFRLEAVVAEEELGTAIQALAAAAGLEPGELEQAGRLTVLPVLEAS